MYGEQPAVEDERHVRLECPLYADIRNKVCDLGASPDVHMDVIMGVENQRALAHVLHCLRICRLELLGE